MEDIMKQALINKAKQLKQTEDPTSVYNLIQDLCNQYNINYKEIENEI